MKKNDSGANTIRGYLIALTREVWREGEGFSGKRPFGNSSWEWDVFRALVDAGYIAGTIDEEYDSLEDFDHAAGNALIFAAIDHLAVSA
jgi:hypothetical protein